MHPFLVYQSNVFLSHYMPSKTPRERDSQMSSLIEKIDSKIKDAGISHNGKLPGYVRSNPNIQTILDGANLLFSGVKNIHSKKGVEKIVARYIKNKEKLREISPQY